MEIFNNGPAPLISAMCRSLGITQAIDWLTEWDERQCKLSPGLLVEAMIINLLGSRKPLYLMHEYFQHMDVATLFGPGIQARDLNDDALARALDKLARAGPGLVYGTIALAAARQEGVDLGHVSYCGVKSVAVRFPPGPPQPGGQLTAGRSDDSSAVITIRWRGPNSFYMIGRRRGCRKAPAESGAPCSGSLPRSWRSAGAWLRATPSVPTRLMSNRRRVNAGQNHGCHGAGAGPCPARSAVAPPGLPSSSIARLRGHQGPWSGRARRGDGGGRYTHRHRQPGLHWYHLDPTPALAPDLVGTYPAHAALVAASH